MDLKIAPKNNRKPLTNRRFFDHFSGLKNSQKASCFWRAFRYFPLWFFGVFFFLFFFFVMILCQKILHVHVRKLLLAKSNISRKALTNMRFESFNQCGGIGYWVIGYWVYPPPKNIGIGRTPPNILSGGAKTPIPNTHTGGLVGEHQQGPCGHGVMAQLDRSLARD